MFLLIPTIDLSEPEFSQEIGSGYSEPVAVIRDATKVAQLWRVQNARLVNLRLAAKPQAASLQVVKEIASTLDIPVLATLPSIPSLDRAKALVEDGVSRLVIEVQEDSRPDEIKSLIRDIGKSKISIAFDSHNLSREPTQALLQLINGCGATKIVICGDNPEMITKHVTRVRDHYPGIRILVRYDVASFQDLELLSSSNSSGLIAGPSLYKNKFPCQHFWCWNYLESVDLDKFSTARLC